MRENRKNSKKRWNMKVTVITTVISALEPVTKGLIKRLGELEIRRVETIQMTLLGSAKKKPGDLRRLVVTQTPVKNHQLTSE